MVTFPSRRNGTRALPFAVLSPAHHRYISVPFPFRSVRARPLAITVFSPRIIQGMMGGLILVWPVVTSKLLASVLSHIKEKSMLKACRADMP